MLRMTWRDSRTLFGAGIAFALASACGGVSRFDQLGPGTAGAASDMGGNSGAGRADDERAGAAPGGSSAAGQSGAGAGSGGSSAGTSAGGASDCSQFADQTTQNVTLTIHNYTSAPVYIGPRMQSCGSTPLFQVLDASGAVLRPPGRCDTPCQGFLDGNPVGGCTADCPLDQVIKLAPREVRTEIWSGVYLSDVALPRDCNASSETSSVTCSVRRRIEPGLYNFVVAAGSEVACDALDDDCGACMPMANGGCSVIGGTVKGDVLNAKTAVNLDASFGVFAEGSGSQGDGFRSVDLVFDSPLE